MVWTWQYPSHIFGWCCFFLKEKMFIKVSCGKCWVLFHEGCHFFFGDAPINQKEDLFRKSSFHVVHQRPWVIKQLLSFCVPFLNDGLCDFLIKLIASLGTVLPENDHHQTQNSFCWNIRLLKRTSNVAKKCFDIALTFCSLRP